MDLNKREDLIKIAFLLGSLILLTIGFSLGYIYVDKSCDQNPFTYGLNELNRINDDEFTCTCISNSGKINPFSFDEEGFKANIFAN